MISIDIFLFSLCKSITVQLLYTIFRLIDSAHGRDELPKGNKSIQRRKGYRNQSPTRKACKIWQAGFFICWKKRGKSGQIWRRTLQCRVPPKRIRHWSISSRLKRITFLSYPRVGEKIHAVRVGRFFFSFTPLLFSLTMSSPVCYFRSRETPQKRNGKNALPPYCSCVWAASQANRSLDALEGGVSLHSLSISLYIPTSRKISRQAAGCWGGNILKRRTVSPSAFPDGRAPTER